VHSSEPAAPRNAWGRFEEVSVEGTTLVALGECFGIEVCARHRGVGISIVAACFRFSSSA